MPIAVKPPAKQISRCRGSLASLGRAWVISQQTLIVTMR
jgi:hypothetical protein